MTFKMLYNPPQGVPLFFLSVSLFSSLPVTDSLSLSSAPLFDVRYKQTRPHGKDREREKESDTERKRRVCPDGRQESHAI